MLPNKNREHLHLFLPCWPSCFPYWAYSALLHLLPEQLTREIGIRKVLGASVLNIVKLVSGDFLKLVALAALIALPVSWFAMHRWLLDFAYRIPLHWWVFAIAGFVSAGIALITLSIRAIQAARVNPVKSLRAE